MANIIDRALADTHFIIKNYLLGRKFVSGQINSGLTDGEANQQDEEQLFQLACVSVDVLAARSQEK